MVNLKQELGQVGSNNEIAEIFSQVLKTTSNKFIMKTHFNNCIEKGFVTISDSNVYEVKDGIRTFATKVQGNDVLWFSDKPEKPLNFGN